LDDFVRIASHTATLSCVVKSHLVYLIFVHVVSRLRAFDVRVVCTEAGIYDDGVISVTSIVSRGDTSSVAL
jgi:hypothetical protein